MSHQFCKVGKIKPNLNNHLNLKELEKRIANFVEDMSKVDFEDGLNTATL